MILWAFIIIGWSSGHPSAQIGPFESLQECSAVRQLVLKSTQAPIGKAVVMTECFNVVAR